MAFRIDYVEWVEKTTQKMETSGKDDAESWNNFWEETYYKELKGKSEDTARKGCLRCAAYSLWMLGQLKCSQKQEIFLSMSVLGNVISNLKNQNKDIARNTTYALLALLLIEDFERKEDFIPDTAKSWALVKEEFERLTDEEAAVSDQGAVKLTLMLYEKRKFKRQI